MRLDDKNLAKKLEEIPAPPPPPELLERLQADIPEAIELGDHGVEHGSRGSAIRRWIPLAASLALVVGGGIFAYWVVENVPGPEGEEWQAPAREKALVLRMKRPRADEGEQPAVAAQSMADPAPADKQEVAEIDELQSPRWVGGRTADRDEGGKAGETAASEDLLTVVPESPMRDERKTFRGGAPRVEPDEESSAVASTMRERLRHLPPGLSEPAPPPPPHVMPPSTGGTTEPNDRPYGDVFFEGYGTNPFVDTEDDALSTFGFDVDTGSWGVVRRYLRDGNLPPHEAVRVEEIVNALDYGDRPPRRGTFALSAEGAPSPWPPGERYWLMRLAVQGKEVQRAEQRPVDLVFVVDVSGSMNYENRLGLVKRSLGLLLDELGAEDRVALVTYGSRGEVQLPFTRDEETIRRAVERLAPEGATNAEEGLTLAYDLAARQGREDAVRRVLLCSDGVANVGRTGPESILERIGEAARSGVELTTVGFGMGNYNDVLMEQLADRGQGRYAYVDTLDEARRIFVEELTGTLHSIAAEARAQVEFDSGIVSRYRLLGYENRDIADERFRDDTVDAAEIGSGHAVTALYEIKLREGVDPRRSSEERLGILRVRYRPIGSQRFEEEELPLELSILRPSWEAASPSWRLAAVAGRFAEVLRGSYWARGADLGDLLRRAEDVAEDAGGDERVAELVEMIRIAARLAEKQDLD